MKTLRKTTSNRHFGVGVVIYRDIDVGYIFKMKLTRERK